MTTAVVLPPTEAPTIPADSSLMRLRDAIPLPVFRPHTRQSAVHAFSRCERRAMWEYLYGLRRPASFKRAATRGTLVHVAMEAAVRSGYPSGDDAEKAMLDAILGVVDDEVARLREEVKNPETLEEIIGDLEQAANVAFVMACLCWEKYPLPPGAEILNLERRIYKPDLYNSSGKTDMLLWDLAAEVWDGHPGVWILDYKTTGKNLEVFEQSRGYAIQTRLYRALVQSELHDQGVDAPLLGILHYMMAPPGIRLSRNDADDNGVPQLSNYLQRVKHWYAGTGPYTSKRVERETSPMFRRTRTVFTGPVLTAETRLQLNRAAASFGLGADARLADFPRNDDACEDYRSPCPYQPLCVAHPSWIGEVLREQGYIQRDPNDDPDTPTEETV